MSNAAANSNHMLEGASLLSLLCVMLSLGHWDACFPREHVQEHIGTLIKRGFQTHLEPLEDTLRVIHHIKVHLVSSNT